MRQSCKNKKGVSLLELILVVVIVGIAAALAIPNVKMGIENRQAKQALETLRSIHNAIRMYQVDRGVLPADLQALQNASYLNSTEYSYLKTGTADANGYEYSIFPNGSGSNTWAQAKRYKVTTSNCGCDTDTNIIRTVQICMNQTKITDTLASGPGILNTTTLC